MSVYLQIHHHHLHPWTTSLPSRQRKREVKFYTQVGLIAVAFSTITLKATEAGGGR